MNIAPNLDFLLLELEEPKLAGGLVMPDTVSASVNGAYARWRVIAAGPGKRSSTGELLPMFFKVGDYVQAPTPINMGTDTQTQQPRLRMPCEWHVIPNPENEGRKLVMARDSEMIGRQDGEPQPVPEVKAAKPVDRRVKQAADQIVRREGKGVLVH